MTFRIIYASRATRSYDRREMRDLCIRSSKRNREDGITGLFLYDGVRFLQAIEGDESKVKATMARIAADDRHSDIIYSFYEAVTHREFSDWSMEIPIEPGEDANTFVSKVKADVRLVTDIRLQAQFIGFAKLAVTARHRIVASG
ncbi:BLUF domain-containing protein [Sphingomonas sp. RHCKR7]|uniref:BLUF domain-containing protein n=1 Tax=Sphingomonas folli TaxID=2862497 RepID=UPI001C66EA26|nr:BLUF domain-containing protein [Sphingomonas folli]MBW6528324.1 BLUF domain-containing protein [Sphingomonas folli]